jgi:hypothetical protein
METDLTGVGHELWIPNEDFTRLLQAVVGDGRPFRFKAQGTSMTPAIRDGDVLTLCPTPRNIPLGAVVCIHPTNEELIIHRVVARTGPNYLVKGDFGSEMDGWYNKADLLGIVQRVEHKGKCFNLGLGPERCIIAWLSRMGLYAPLISLLLRCRAVIKNGRIG